MSMPQYDGANFENDHLYDDDKLLYVEFFMQAVQDNVRSAQEGRPIFNEKPMIKVITPGSRDVMVTRATDAYQRRFPKHWDRFQKQLTQVMEGTPLDQVPWLTVGVIAELKGVNCFTLEQLAGMSDQLAGKMMGMHGYRQKAKAFLDAASAAAPFTQMQAELEQRDIEINVLKQQVAQLLQAQTVAKEATS